MSMAFSLFQFEYDYVFPVSNMLVTRRQDLDMNIFRGVIATNFPVYMVCIFGTLNDRANL